MPTTESAESWDLCVKENRDRSFSCIYQDSTPTPIDLTGATVVWEVRDKYSDTEPTISARSDEATGSYIDLLDQDANTGEYILYLKAEDTLGLPTGRTYTHGCYIIDSNGNNIEQWEGEFKIEPTTPR